MPPLAAAISSPSGTPPTYASPSRERVSVADDKRVTIVYDLGRPIAILSAVTEETLEETLKAIRQARAITAVSELQRRSVELGADEMNLEEINAEI
jgi:hypothetical protein